MHTGRRACDAGPSSCVLCTWKPPAGGPDLASTVESWRVITVYCMVEHMVYLAQLSLV